MDVQDILWKGVGIPYTQKSGVNMRQICNVSLSVMAEGYQLLQVPGLKTFILNVNHKNQRLTLCLAIGRMGGLWKIENHPFHNGVPKLVHSWPS